MIIGICGFIGSGKDTIADYLVNLHHFRRESFANIKRRCGTGVWLGQNHAGGPYKNGP